MLVLYKISMYAKKTSCVHRGYNRIGGSSIWSVVPGPFRYLGGAGGGESSSLSDSNGPGSSPSSSKSSSSSRSDKGGVVGGGRLARRRYNYVTHIPSM